MSDAHSTNAPENDPPLSLATIGDIAAELRRRSGKGFGFALFISNNVGSLDEDPTDSALYSTTDDASEQAWFFGVAISQALESAVFNKPHLEGRGLEVQERARQLLHDLWLIHDADEGGDE